MLWKKLYCIFHRYTYFCLFFSIISLYCRIHKIASHPKPFPTLENFLHFPSNHKTRKPTKTCHSINVKLNSIYSLVPLKYLLKHSNTEQQHTNTTYNIIPDSLLNFFIYLYKKMCRVSASKLFQDVLNTQREHFIKLHPANRR
jgi:hypothetical protein